MFKSEVTDQFPLDQMWPINIVSLGGRAVVWAVSDLLFKKKYLNSVN